MTAYQQLWNKDIANLLDTIGATDNLRKNVVGNLRDASRSGMFPNIIINALKLAIEVQKGSITIGLLSPMQSGKSASMNFLCNYILPEIGYLGTRDHAIFVTSMRDTDLYEQNVKNLQNNYFDYVTNSWLPSKIRVLKIDYFFRHPNPFQCVEDYSAKLVLRDEDQYGAGEESTFDAGFFQKLRQQLPKIPLISVSATPFDILDAKLQGYPVAIIEGNRPPTYLGITEMLKKGLIEDLPWNFEPYTESISSTGQTILDLGPDVERYIDHMLGFESGLGIIRVSKTAIATQLRQVIRNKYSTELECLAIGSGADTDYSIQEGIQEVKSRVLNQQKRVVLIVVHALSAGKDFRLLKDKIRFAIETRRAQLANGSQGLPGRICGYHTNRDFKLMAPIDLLERYSEFEQDWEVFSDDDWKNSLFNDGIKGLSTQCKLNSTRRAGKIRPIESITIVPFEELGTPEGDKKLAFLNDKAMEEVKKNFTKERYESNTKDIRLKTFAKNTTMRMASSYEKAENNRVFKYWNCELGDDFGGIMFKKSDTDYGLLIVNFPADHPKNQLGFCGLKIIKAGTEIEQSQISSTSNDSMYPA